MTIDGDIVFIFFSFNTALQVTQIRWPEFAKGSYRARVGLIISVHTTNKCFTEIYEWQISGTSLNDMPDARIKTHESAYARYHSSYYL